jgi:asparagine synthetase B (glutamine-hydrolysing)
MCGIAGIFDVARSAEFDRVTLARELLLQIQRRGRHATGYAYVAQNATVIEKADLPAEAFVQLAPMFLDGLGDDPRAIILHTRYATQGNPRVNLNNHPIHSKQTGLTLIHNGWLTNERQILAKYHLRKDGEVDSETVLRLIEHFLLKGRRSINRAIKLAMKELKGVFACALISERYPNTLWLWRDNNPLHVYTDTGALIFASTEDLLSAALREAGIAGGKIMEFPNAMICRLMIVKGEVRAAFERLKIRKRPTQPGKEKAKKTKTKKSKPLKNQHPLIGMPARQPAFPTLEAWNQWKKQGREIEGLLSATLENLNGEIKGIKFV